MLTPEQDWLQQQDHCPNKKRKWHIHTKGNAINLDNEAPGTDIHIITFINAILVHKMDPRYMEV